MKLTDLAPRWWGDDGRVLGVSFLCPHCRTTRLGVAFANPPDGGPPSPIATDAGMPKSLTAHVHEHRSFDVPPGHLWQRSGDTFDTLTLSPSVDASRAGCWHGTISHGNVS